MLSPPRTFHSSKRGLWLSNSKILTNFCSLLLEGSKLLYCLIQQSNCVLGVPISKWMLVLLFGKILHLWLTNMGGASYYCWLNNFTPWVHSNGGDQLRIVSHCTWCICFFFLFFCYSLFTFGTIQNMIRQFLYSLNFVWSCPRVRQAQSWPETTRRELGILVGHWDGPESEFHLLNEKLAGITLFMFIGFLCASLAWHI